jgi:hypothetical protein
VLYREVAPSLPPLIHPLPTLHRARLLPTEDACGATATNLLQKEGGGHPPLPTQDVTEATILQILSLTLFEKTHLLQLLIGAESINEDTDMPIQLNLFDNFPGH